MPENEGDLSVTALYTCGAWAWGRLPEAELLDHPAARWVFRVVNAVLAIAGVFARGAPLRVALVHRHALIDALLRTSGHDRVLELAAGLSRRGSTFSGQSRIEYVEVDRPHVIDAKRRLLERTEAGRQVLARSNLRLLAADATSAPFDELSPPDGKPLFVIAEGLLMYLDAEAQRTLARAIAARLRDAGGTFVFDYVPPCEQPPPGRVGRTLERWMKRFTGGKSFARDERTRAQVIEDLLACGFDGVEALEPREVALEYELPHPGARTQQLVFVATVHAKR